MPNNEDRWIDELLATHRSETWSTGWNNDASDKAKAAIQAKLLEARLMERELIELEIAASHKKRYAQLQASAPTKKGEDHG